jgi:DNA-binding CsgD family transcriptional regulator
MDVAAVYGRELSSRERQRLADALLWQTPLLVYDRPGHGLVGPVRLDGGERLIVGRSPHADIRIEGDEFVSAVHLALVPLAGYWTVEDLGSTNGTRLAGEPTVGPRRLRHEDTIEIGTRTRLLYLVGQAEPPTPQLRLLKAPELTERERDVLQALAMHRRSDPGAGPASNEEIAKALHLGVETVRSHVKSLYRKAGIEGKVPDGRLHLMLLGAALALRRAG